MASIYDIKPRFQALLRPLTRSLAAAGVTANQITILACLLSIGTGAWIAYMAGLGWRSPAPLLAVPAVMFVRMALNAIDGMLAREHDMKTPLGAILNELTDVISDAALYFPFALIPGFEPAWVIGVVFLAALSEMTGVIGVQIGASRRYDGPMGKSDRAFFFGALSLALGAGVAAGAWLNPLLIVVLFLLALTIGNRARGALSELERS